jgi:hypothetical protein
VRFYRKAFADKPQTLTSELKERLKVEAGMYRLRLADGSESKVRLLTEEIVITTPYGQLKVPVAYARRIEVGFRYPEGVEKRIGAAVARLGDADFKAREAASEELRRLKAWAYPALKRAAGSEDLEVSTRVGRLLREMKNTAPAEQLQRSDRDIVVTPSFTIVGRLQAQALKVHSAKAGVSQVQLADILQVRSATEELLLLERVRTAVRAGRTTLSQQMGSGENPYKEVPEEGALLTGFEVTYGKFGDSRTVMTVRPIFLTASGRVRGVTHGVPGEGLVRVEARPGYAVGAVTIKAGLGVDGMSVTFMEIGSKGLDPSHAYESEWLGGMGGGEKTKLGGSGAPVVGIFGKTADRPGSTFNGLGLVTEAPEE